MSIEGKLRCSYPLHAIAIPESVFSDESFRTELSSFLAQMDVDEFEDATPKTRKAGTKVSETRDTVDSHHISQLLVAILGGLGHVNDVPRTQKRIADEVLWLDAEKPWRRSPLWLVIRVALQRTLQHRHEYKQLMLYILCQVIYKALEYDLNSDLVFTMRAKVSRRCYKLSGSPTPTFVYSVAEDCVKHASVLLQSRWKKIQNEQTILPPWNRNHWDIASSTCLTMPRARVYISNVLTRTNQTVVSSFSPNDPYRFNGALDISSYAHGKLLNKFRDQGLYVLHDFEETVLTQADLWPHSNLANVGACDIIETCFQQYYQSAKIQYADNSEDRSIMTLILVELWVILDTIACQQFPLLRDYAPDIPITFLNPILLRHSRHIDCADTVEQYIARRNQQAQYTSVFSDTVTSTSISTRHFRESTRLQDLKSRIEQSANTLRSEKMAELEKVNEKYQTYRSQSSALEHETTQRWDTYGDVHTDHSRSCEKCRLEKAATNLEIDVHEWPLPSHQMEAEALVFELACPTVFAVWRNVTFELLCTIGAPGTHIEPSPRPERDLHRSDLNKWLEHPSSRQITLASTTKQFTRSHYGSRKIPADSSDVLLPHGSRWRLYDRTSKTWASDGLSHSDLLPYGTSQIPAGSPYAYLQHTLAETVHTSNTILAKQDECPTELTLHEHIAFGTLRSGGRIQWFNILRELASNALSFEREEVHLLLLQASSQLGPRSSHDPGSLREWHEPLADPSYVVSLLNVLGTLLVGIEANWRQVVTLKTIGGLFAILNRIVCSLMTLQ